MDTARHGAGPAGDAGEPPTDRRIPGQAIPPEPAGDDQHVGSARREGNRLDALVRIEAVASLPAVGLELAGCASSLERPEGTQNLTADDPVEDEGDHMHTISVPAVISRCPALTGSELDRH